MEVSILMTDGARALLLPVGVMVLWTTFLMGLMAFGRTQAVKTGELPVTYFKAHIGATPGETLKKRDRAFENLFEYGFLFYPAVLFAIVTGVTGSHMLVAAWLFTLARIIQGGVHISFNHVGLRFIAFIASILALLYMWWQIIAIAL